MSTSTAPSATSSGKRAKAIDFARREGAAGGLALASIGKTGLVGAQYAALQRIRPTIFWLAGLGLKRGAADEVAVDVFHVDRPDRPASGRGGVVHVLTVEIHAGFEAQGVARAEATGRDAG